MSRFLTFVQAVAAGACIAIGGALFLSVESKVVGSLLFAVGLFTIMTMGLNLYTGKVCYVFEKDREFAIGVPIIWLGNLAGTWLAAALLGLTRIGPALAEKAMDLCRTKLGDDLLSIFVLAIFCNMMIYIAVDTYANNRDELGKYLGLLFGIPVFILCGFEHCVANMFYFSMAGVWDGTALLYMLVMTVGNAVGGWVFPAVKMLKKRAGGGGRGGAAWRPL